MREDKVKVVLEVRKEPNVTYIEGYNGTLLDPNKVGEDEAGDSSGDVDDETMTNNDMKKVVILSQENPASVVVGDGNRVKPNDDDNDASFGGQENSKSDSLSSVSSPGIETENSRSKTSSINGSIKKSTRKKSLELTLTCTTENAKPPVTHHWSKIIGDKKQKLKPVDSKIINVDEITGVTTTKSTVRLNLSPKDKV